MLPCNTDYTPLCGSDGLTYWNECIMKNTPGAPTKFKSGPCMQRRKNSFCHLIRCSSFSTLRVCGSDGFEYSNRCEFERMQCYDPSLSGIDLDCAQVNIQKSNISCPAVINEASVVCGSDRYNYVSQCALENAQQKVENLTRLKNGKCSDCDFYCIDQFDPVCGQVRGMWKTFSNKCYRSFAMCDDPAITPCQD